MNPIIDDINSIHSDRARVVAFDIGGVLVKINRHWEDALREAGIKVRPIGGLNAFPGVETLQIGAMSPEEYFADLQAFLGLTDERQAEEVHKLILVEPYPGTLELIEDLNEQGIVTACLSNTNEPHWIEMTAGRFPNVGALQVTAVSHELKLQKPEQSMYEAFESLVEARPREIVFFDDTEENVDAALERGWRAYWIDHEKDTAEQMELILIAEGVLAGP